MCSAPSSVSALPTGATGIRKSDAVSTTSAVVRCVVHAWMLRSRSSLSTGSARRAGESERSLRSTMARKSAHICAELVLNPTQPSAVGSMEGNSMSSGWLRQG